MKSRLAEKGFAVTMSITQNPARDPSFTCGKIRVGPASEASVDAGVIVLRERIEEVRIMREVSKGTYCLVNTHV